jgi:ABC-type transport system involved in multi-copper enzyme maturation permease subunit
VGIVVFGLPVRGVTLKNAPWSALWPNLAILAAFAIILFAISAWRFRKI